MGFADRFSLEGKTAFVTGASYGLGVGFAKALAEAGANVVLAARSVDKLTDVARQLDGLGVKTLVQHCDVTDPATVRAAVEMSVPTTSPEAPTSSLTSIATSPAPLPTSRTRIPGPIPAPTKNLLVIGSMRRACVLSRSNSRSE